MSNTNNTNTAEIIKYDLDNGGAVELSPQIVRNYLVNGNDAVTDQEVMMFIELCKYQKINPFIREAYLIKYGTAPASIVCGKEFFMKRAENNPNFEGFEAGVIVMTSENKINNRPGTTYLPKYGEKLIGGWAKIYRKGYKIPIENTAMYEEFSGKSPIWGKMPALMIRKVALVQALREAFPDMYGGLYSQEEISTVNQDDLPTEHINPSDAEEILYGISDAISRVDDVESANKAAETIKSLGLVNGEKKKAAEMLNAKTSELGLKWNKEEKRYEIAEIVEPTEAVEFVEIETNTETEPEENSAEKTAALIEKSRKEHEDYAKSTGINPNVKSSEAISEAQIKLLYARASDHYEDADQKKNLIHDIILLHGYEHVSDIVKSDFNDILKEVEAA